MDKQEFLNQVYDLAQEENAKLDASIPLLDRWEDVYDMVVERICNVSASQRTEREVKLGAKLDELIIATDIASGFDGTMPDDIIGDTIEDAIEEI